MKKLFSLLMLVAFFSTATFAQTPAQRTTTTTSAQTSKSSVGVKKDGTPDKRYKMNKAEKTTTTAPMKKDGTPDKRYKANKTAPKM
ncbi:MAG: hypothetical protein EOP42_08585 [Sphingobacteriaceae bacterium]|nr:MAG: hypothetical protein EOP42_08585 [Sphingobacteriaceae bacterium]